jgi:heat shock protein HtpX
MNALKTTLLLGLLSGLLVLAGQRFGGDSGLVLGLLMAVGMNFFSYFFSEKMALMSSHAQPVSATEHPEIYRRLAPIVKGIADKMGLPMPRLWVTPEPSPNAFATGRNPHHASVAVTAGLLQLMSDEELAGVLAHEMGHVKNRDILISSIAATLGAALTFVARMGMWFGGGSRDGESRSSPLGGLLMLFLAPIAAGLIQMSISRTREFSADEASARAIGSGAPLANALGKLDMYSHQIPMEVAPTQAHMYIMEPLRGKLSRLFSTHPSTEERVARLRALQL